jgi:acyl-CoA oxidase
LPKVQVLENGADWTGFITRDQLAGVNKAVFYLLGEIRRNAVPLVDSFDFSDNELRSAIGRYDGNV